MTHTIWVAYIASLEATKMTTPLTAIEHENYYGEAATNDELKALDLEPSQLEALLKIPYEVRKVGHRTRMNELLKLRLSI